MNISEMTPKEIEDMTRYVKAAMGPAIEMPLRDYFAAAALQGLLANPKLQEQILKSGGAHGGWIESSAWGFANAMIKER